MEMSFGLYLHIPFCVAKCFYCDFFSVPLETGSVAGVVQAMRTELLLWQQALLNRRETLPAISSIYFGGGTPSCLPPSALIALLQSCRHLFPTKDPEITVEINPETISGAAISQLQEYGVNRISVGVQSFQDRILPALGRRHSAAQAFRACSLVRSAGIENLSIDLMLGLPGQTMTDLQADLAAVQSIAPEHVSAYLLKLAEGTRLQQQVRNGMIRLPDDDDQAAMYSACSRALIEAGYEHYEISNFARPGYEARHNSLYWDGREYIGVGPGAHSAIKNWMNGDGLVRMANLEDLEEYQQRIARWELPCAYEMPIARADEIAEFMFLGLRRRQGVSQREFKSRFGTPLWSHYSRSIQRWLQTGLLQLEGDRLYLTHQGWLLSNEILADFLPAEES